MKWILCLFAFTCCAGRYPPLESVNTIAKGEYSVTVRLQVACLGGLQVGTGVIVSNRDVITAKHVITCTIGKPIGVVATDVYRQTFLLVLDKESEARDIARLRAHDGTTPFKYWARLDSTPKGVGEIVCSVGGDTVVFMMRKCGEVLPGPEDGAFIVSNIHTVPGNSGGPLFDDVGSLIGIIVRGRWTEGDEYLSIAENLGNVKGELLGDLYPSGF